MLVQGQGCSALQSYSETALSSAQTFLMNLDANFNTQNLGPPQEKLACELEHTFWETVENVENCT